MGKGRGRVGRQEFLKRDVFCPFHKKKLMDDPINVDGSQRGRRACSLLAISSYNWKGWRNLSLLRERLTGLSYGNYIGVEAG